MKTFLILVLFSHPNLIYEKIEIKNYTNCYDAFEKKSTWHDNPNFKEGDGQVWGFYIYDNKQIVASFCKDQEGNWLS